MKRLLIATTIMLLTASAASAESDPKKLVGLRETVGSVQISGWQNSLVRGDPNLGHWHWTPMYANIQRVRGGPPDPRMTQSNPSTTAVTPTYQQTHYIKPIQVPLPVPQWAKELPKYAKMPTQVAYQNSNNSHSTLNGKFLNKNVPSVATYHNDYASAPPSLVERQSVRGRLAHPSI